MTAKIVSFKSAVIHLFSRGSIDAVADKERSQDSASVEELSEWSPYVIVEFEMWHLKELAG